MTAATRLKEYRETGEKKAEPVNKGSLSANLLELAQCENPESQKKMIFAMLADAIGQMDFLGSRVFVATYITPQKKGSIWMPEKKIDASRFEGKCGLVLMLGPSAFKYDGAWPYEGPKPKVGDWIQYRASDAREFGFCDVYCREIEDHLVKAIVKDPSKIW